MAFRKAELVQEVLSLPALALEPGPAGVAVRTSGELETLLRKAISRLRSSAAAGEPADQAVCSLLPKNHAKIWAVIAKAIASSSIRSAHAKGGDGGRPAPDINAVAPLLYEHAVEAIAQGKNEEAIVALGLVAGSDAGRADGLLGLAVCAARLQDYDTARTLALESLKLRPGHPRACCIVGRCELERGDRRAAQQYLALAARMARQQPEFRDDMRAAQRLLLMMHIA